MYTVVFDFPLIGICRINFEKKEQFEYVKRQFLNYYVSYKVTSDKMHGIQSCLSFDNKEVVRKFQLYSRKNLGLSRNVYWKNECLLIGNYNYSIKNGSVKIYVMKSKTKKALLKYLYHNITNRSEEKRYAFQGGEFYQCALFPLISVYSACFGMFCVHGSLIHLNNGENIIISGLDGVGKSTLADMICSNESHLLLGDNIILFNGSDALNFNIAMRLENDTPTKLDVIYFNKKIKEVLPKTISYGMCHIDKIYNLLRDYKNTDITEYTDSLTPYEWIMFMESAPEIGQANKILSFWLMMHALVFKHNEIEVQIASLSVPNGKLSLAKELILK